MNRFLLATTLALSVLALAACGRSDTPAADAPGPSSEIATPAGGEPAAPAEARMEDGVQVAEITVTPRGYTPAAIRLRPGVPARLVFTRTEDGGCAQQVKAPALGVAEPLDLPLNDPVAVAFTPSEAGTFSFTCGMDMLTGSVVVQS